MCSSPKPTTLCSPYYPDQVVEPKPFLHACYKSALDSLEPNHSVIMRPGSNEPTSMIKRRLFTMKSLSQGTPSQHNHVTKTVENHSIREAWLPFFVFLDVTAQGFVNIQKVTMAILDGVLLSS